MTEINLDDWKEYQGTFIKSYEEYIHKRDVWMKENPIPQMQETKCKFLFFKWTIREALHMYIFRLRMHNVQFELFNQLNKPDMSKKDDVGAFLNWKAYK